MKSRTIRRIYLREAVVMIILARLAIRFIPPASLFAWASRPLHRVNRFATAEAKWVSWAIETAGAKPWMNALCLPRSLAAHAMLRRRGIASRLCLGVAREGPELVAHAWIEVAANTIVPDPEVSRFTRLADFGGASP